MILKNVLKIGKFCPAGESRSNSYKKAAKKRQREEMDLAIREHQNIKKINDFFTPITSSSSDSYIVDYIDDEDDESHSDLYEDNEPELPTGEPVKRASLQKFNIQHAIDNLTAVHARFDKSCKSNKNGMEQWVRVRVAVAIKYYLILRNDGHGKMEASRRAAEAHFFKKKSNSYKSKCIRYWSDYYLM